MMHASVHTLGPVSPGPVGRLIPGRRSVSLALLPLLLALMVAGCGKRPPKAVAQPGPKAAASGKTAAQKTKSKAAEKGADSAAGEDKSAAVKTPAAKTPAAAGQIPRAEFNRLLAALNEPVFWGEDSNGDGIPQPTELLVLWSRETTGTLKDWQRYVKFGRMGMQWIRARRRVQQVKSGGWPWRNLPPEEMARRKAVMRELNQGRPTVIVTDLRKATPAVRAFVGHMAKVGHYIEVLYRRQRGALGLEAQIPERDLPSQALFQRNQGPWCQAPATEKDATCHGLPKMPPRRSGLYPVELQKTDATFCQTLAKHKDAKRLLAPFTAVRYAKSAHEASPKNSKKAAKPGKKRTRTLVAIPYARAFPDESEAIARELEAAAKAMQTEATEATLVVYLRAAAKAFRDNQWFKADEAWAKMAGSPSRWYVRVGPDETYFEPCNRKAGYALALARIDPSSAAWKKKLEPRKNELERLVATAAGAPYKARSITFHLPEFIHVVLNAGDNRSATGATVGQSLPNWGPVAEQSRGRTVAMTNLYTDPDSRATLKRLAESVFCGDTITHMSFEAAPQTMSTVLHEAGHNLGPSHAYRVGGKTGSEIFGGPTASILEELKAQTMALAFNPWLVEKKLITQEFGRSAWLRDVAWAFGHIAQGMTTSSGKPKAYSQLAAVQVGLLLEAGGLRWQAKVKAANDRDMGCFSADFAKFKTGVAAMAKTVYGIKARGDAQAAKALLRRFVSEGSEFAKLRATVRERWLRAPRASFVYSLRY